MLQAAALHSLLHEARSEAVMMMMILVLQLPRAAVVSQGHQKKPKRDTLPPCLWHPHRGGPDAGDHHGFLNRLWRSSAWSFLLRDRRQVHLPHQPLRRYSACSRRLQQL